MRGKREGQSHRCCQLRAEAARPEESYGNAAPLAGNGFDNLSGLFRAQIGLQLPKKLRKIVTALTRIAPESPHGVEIAARRASQAEIDSCGIKCLECAKLFGYHKGSVVGQHDAATSYANCPGR